MTDDEFEYFRGWLVMQGRQVYEAALANPESLLDVLEGGEVECEDILYAPLAAYEAVTGRPLTVDGPAPPSEPSGARWNEDDLASRFPRLVAAFG